MHAVLELYVDADSCPVKDEIYRVAYRYALTVHVVANQSVHVAASDSFHFVLVGDRFDEADDWIAERASEGDIVITAGHPARRALPRERRQGARPPRPGLQG